MWRAVRSAEPHGVRDALPFGLLIGIGSLCSAAAVAVGWAAPASAPPGGLPVSSAQTDAGSNAAPKLVTDPPPNERAIATEEPAGSGEADRQYVGSPDQGRAEAVAAGARAGRAPEEHGLPPVGALPAAVSEPSVPLVDAARAAELFERMNDARSAEGIPALAWDDALAEVAVARGESLIRDQYFDHYGPDGSSAFSELSARGIAYRLAGENLARNNYGGATTVAVAFEALMASPGHRANILEPRFSRAGVAVVRDGRYWLYVTVFTD